jgi:hypothetical protein
MIQSAFRNQTAIALFTLPLLLPLLAFACHKDKAGEGHIVIDGSSTVLPLSK